MPRRGALVGAALLCLASVPQLSANAVFTYTASDSGWYRNLTGENAKGIVSPSDTSYFAGEFPNPNGHTYRDFFIFNIAGLIGNVVSATLTLDDGGGGAVAGGPLTFNIGSVSDSAATVGSSSSSTTVYNDLAGGTLFGTTVGITAAGNVVITFNGAGLTALGTAGSGFVLGGYITAIGDAANHYLFTNGSNLALESLSIVTDAPEPAAFGIVGIGLVGLGLIAKRRAPLQ